MNLPFEICAIVLDNIPLPNLVYDIEADKVWKETWTVVNTYQGQHCVKIKILDMTVPIRDPANCEFAKIHISIREKPTSNMSVDYMVHCSVFQNETLVWRGSAKQPFFDQHTWWSFDQRWKVIMKKTIESYFELAQTLKVFKHI